MVDGSRQRDTRPGVCQHFARSLFQGPRRDAEGPLSLRERAGVREAAMLEGAWERPHPLPLPGS
jgi:hypothetical protein